MTPEGHPYFYSIGGRTYPALGACVAVSRSTGRGFAAIVTPEIEARAGAILKGMERLPSRYLSLVELVDPSISLGHIAIALWHLPDRPAVDCDVYAAIYGKLTGTPFFLLDSDPQTETVHVSPFNFDFAAGDILPTIHRAIEAYTGRWPDSDVPVAAKLH